jgi:DNA ligase 1
MKTFKPMLAATLTSSCEDEVIKEAMSKLRYPVIVSEKLDGIRAFNHPELGLVSRTLKPIPNKYLRSIAKEIPFGMDCELYSPDFTFQEITSSVMSEYSYIGGSIRFYVLDDFLSRHNYVSRILQNYKFMHQLVEFPQTIYVNNANQLWSYYDYFAYTNKEGICFRTPDSPYKFGRSTLKEQYLVKLACAKIGIADVVGFVEKMINLAPANKSNLGLSQRKTGKLLPANTLGALVVRADGVEFNIGTGFDDNLRKEIWDNKVMWIGRAIKYQSKTVGTKDKPRTPVYKGIV